MIELPAGWRLVLASSSPRRRELLSQLGVPFEVRPADLDEAVRPGEGPLAYVERLARAKAEIGAAAGEIVVAADTTVELGGTILAKPVDAVDAVRMLTALAGRDHRVHTGVAVTRVDGPLRGPMEAVDRFATSMVVSTTVWFAPLSAAEIEWYVATGEPLDKAGAYGIQGRAGPFVTRVEGSVSNVVGLPLAETVALLRTAIGGAPSGVRRR